MRKKIQNSMLLVILVSLLISFCISIVFIYFRVRQITMESIRYEAESIAAGLNVAGTDVLVPLDQSDIQTRLTLIDGDGNVQYDSEQADYTFENHSNRPEVIAAMKYGSGSDIRRSDTIGRDMVYFAVRLQNGNILRAARSMRSVVFTALEFLPFFIGLMLLMLLFSVFFARHQAAVLVRPINTLKLDEPLSNEVYEELRPLLKRIDEQNKAKDAISEMRKEFSANVSHELKTPLTSISGYAEIIKDGIVKPADIPSFAERIYKESRRLIALIDDIIELSKLDENEVPIKREWTDIFNLSRDVCETLMQKAEWSKVRLELRGEHCQVLGVPRLLQEMLYNIIENAIKYNRENGRVDVWVGRRKEGPMVIVSDTGIGIPEDQLDRIFERFYRVDKSHSRETGGTGLGLSIAKHSAMINHAEISVKSRLGQGTRMEILFQDNKDTV